MKTPSKTLFKFNPLFGIAYLLVILSSAFLLATPYYKFAIVPVLCVLALFILAMKPQIAYLFILFLIPLDAYTSLWNTHPNLTLTKLIGFWLFIVVSFYYLLRKRELTPTIFSANIWKWLWLFFIINLLSALMSDFYATSFYGIRRLLVAYLFLALTLAIISYKDLSKRIPAVIILSNAIGSFLAVIGYVFQLKYFATGLGASENALERAEGLSAGPNVLAMMILFGFPFIVHLFFTSKRMGGKVLAIILMGLSISSLILTHSRSGTLVFLVLIIFLAIAYRRYLRPKNWGFLMIFLSVAIILFITFAPTSYKKRMFNITHAEADTSFMGRFSYIHVAWQSFKKHPVLGTGPSTFAEIYSRSNTPRKYLYMDYKRAAHNVYLEILVGTGILGLATFLMIPFFTIKNILRARKSLITKNQKGLIALYDTYLLSFLSLLIFFYMLSRLYNKYFWMMIALAPIMLVLSEKIEEARQDPSEPVFSLQG